ncbi:MAG: hypothetical protein KF799_03530 [Bdellovibrionales bacterium]|nr:hypothetical protein [Bdellovibrionales bacterium]
MQRILGLLLLATLCGAAQAQTYRPLGDGMPLPWPFPWAKDCPVDWESMQGRYALMPSDTKEQINLKITVVKQLNFTVVRVSRFGPDGIIIADGYTWIPLKQKTVRLWLFPLRRGDPPTWAVLKLYHQNSYARECAQEALVPILTLEQVDNTIHRQAQYRLVRVSLRN